MLEADDGMLFELELELEFVTTLITEFASSGGFDIGPCSVAFFSLSLVEIAPGQCVLSLSHLQEFVMVNFLHNHTSLKNLF